MNLGPRSAKPAALALLLAVGACASNGQLVTQMAPAGAQQTQAAAGTKDPSGPTNKVVTAAAPKRVISGLGYATVSAQPGKTLNERRLLAVKAARLEAMRDLTEQVFGLRINGELSLRDATVHNDNLRGVVSGTIRGARTVRITPKGDDTYEVLLELDSNLIRNMIRAVLRKA